MMSRIPTSCLQVLVVEHDTAARKLACQLLISLGHEVQPADAGGEGLVYLGKGGYDVVVAGTAAPGTTGWDIAATVRRAAPTIGVVLVTDSISRELTERARAERLVLVTKPFDSESLEEAVTRALTLTGRY